MKRLNILLITADQMRGDCIGALGHPDVETPNLDTMVNQGTAFTRCYSATPTCIPARAALFTGQSQEHHGCRFADVKYSVTEEFVPAFYGLLQFPALFLHVNNFRIYIICLGEQFLSPAFFSKISVYQYRFVISSAQSCADALSGHNGDFPLCTAAAC